MVDIGIENNRVELRSYDSEATLADLRNAVERARYDSRLVTYHCAGCGRCCYTGHLPLFGLDLVDMRSRRSTNDLTPWIEFPEPPDLDERRRGIDELARQHRLDIQTAILLYEFNVAEPITYRKGANGGCVFLQNGFCSNYEGRAYTCGLYVCNMGERLSVLQESIVRQGVWHSYFVEGWISEKEIKHNPFLGHTDYDTILLSGFDIDLSDALQSLFFYF